MSKVIKAARARKETSHNSKPMASHCKKLLFIVDRPRETLNKSFPFTIYSPNCDGIDAASLKKPYA